MRYSSSSASLTPATTSVADDLGNYNAVGLATQYTVEVNTDTTAAYNYTNTYKYDYVGFGGSYREARQQASITLPGYTAGTTTTTFDSHGNAIQIDNPNGEPKSQRLIVDAQGRILHKDVTKKDNSVVHQDYAYVNGNPIGSNGDAESSTYDYNYTPISDQYPASNPGQYIVQSSGETLQGIAQSVFGDANLWYLIADANGLSAGATLVAGQALTIPNQVSNLHNDANTFRPYQPNEIIGDTTAAVKAPPPPSHKSNIFATILIAVVVVVATAFTAGAAAAALGPVLGPTLGTLAGAAIGGAIGSAAGQAVGIGLGVQSSFSFSQVAIGALTQVATVGIGLGIDELSQVGAFGNQAQAAQNAAVAARGASAGSQLANNATTLARAVPAGVRFAQGALQGLVTSVAGQGINIALGQQKSFSFAGVAASAITSGIGSSLGENDPLRRIPGSNNPGLSFSGVAAASLRNTAYGVLNRSITVALEGHGKINVANIAADGFGNALGNAVVGEIRQSDLEQKQRVANLQQELTQEEDQRRVDGLQRELAAEEDQRNVAGLQRELGDEERQRTETAYYDSFDRGVPYNANADGSPTTALSPSTTAANRQVAELNRRQAPSLAQLATQGSQPYVDDGFRFYSDPGTNRPVTLGGQDAFDAASAIAGVPNLPRIGEYLDEQYQAFIRNPTVVRTLGALGLVGGTIQAGTAGAAAVLTSETGIGAVGFGIVSGVGVDEAQAGLRQLISGQYVTPVGVQLLERAGISPTAASLTYGAAGLVGGIGAALSLEGLVPAAARASTAEASGFPNRIYSARVLIRSAEEPGPAHNFPLSFDEAIRTYGAATYGSDGYVQYNLEGTLTLPQKPIFAVPGTPAYEGAGKSIAIGLDVIPARVPPIIGYTPPRVIAGTYELGVFPSASGRTEVVAHRFFRPN
ncbi:MAG: LysM peptidoglycan-binding domain-containing protein [Nevskia sp.]|nr:LysM peptidoglycan-binding domain-containing protein [Nevskia sp.]